MYELGDLGGSSSSIGDARLFLEGEKKDSLDGLCLRGVWEFNGVDDLNLDPFNGAGIRMQFWWKEPWTLSVS